MVGEVEIEHFIAGGKLCLSLVSVGVGGGGQRRGVGVCNSYSQTFWRGITVMPVLSEWGGGVELEG